MTQTPARPQRPVPVTILTGFLGSGKTTLLNYILTERHGHRIAVIENEFGAVDVDSDLVLASEEEIFQVANGCICCVVDVRNDLVKILQKLLERQDQFDHILVETSGLADPVPVAATFFMDNEVARRVVLDGVVTLVDALHIGPHLDDPALAEHDNQAVSQIVVADRVLLNKVDLVDAGQIAEVERRIRRLNATAPIMRSVQARVDLRQVLGLQSYAADALAQTDPHFLEADEHAHVCDAHCAHGHAHGDPHAHGDAPPATGARTVQATAAHQHDPSVSSESFVFESERFDAVRLQAALRTLLAAQGDDIFRLKGIVAVAGDERQHVLQAVHQVLDFKPSQPWGDKPPTSKFVFIGRKLDRARLQARLLACAAQAETTA